MPEFTVTGLRIVHQVAATGSFTRAAELLGYTQSAVSRQVAAMEAAAGAPIFDRSRRGVALTPAGATPLVELYELRLSARSIHRSEPHAPGTHEVLVVLSGVLALHVEDERVELNAGDAVAFAADRPHSYENPASSEARYHNVIVYER